MGRDWISPPGNLYASTIVRLQPNDPSAASLAFVAAVAVYQTLKYYAPELSFQIKWPNDILSAAGEKMCGMLLERSGDAVIAGIGVNLKSHPSGLERTVSSLQALGGHSPDPQIFLERLAAYFTNLLDQWRVHGLQAILSVWHQNAHPVGTMLLVNLPDGEVLNGQYDGLYDDGGLKLRLADGHIRAIHAADVFLI